MYMIAIVLLMNVYADAFSWILVIILNSFMKFEEKIDLEKNKFEESKWELNKKKTKLIISLRVLKFFLFFSKLVFSSSLLFFLSMFCAYIFSWIFLIILIHFIITNDFLFHSLKDNWKKFKIKLIAAGKDSKKEQMLWFSYGKRMTRVPFAHLSLLEHLFWWVQCKKKGELITNSNLARKKYWWSFCMRTRFILFLLVFK